MLSRKTKYAIHAAHYLAKHPEEQPISVSRISEARTIALKFLEAIRRALKIARLVTTTKGRHGGYRGNGHPAAIDLARVRRFLDGAIAILPCATYYYVPCQECVDAATCGILTLRHTCI